MRRILAAITAAGLIAPSVTTSLPAAAQHMGDPVRGAELAQAWCSECHEIGPEGALGEPSLLPAFRDVAQDPIFTELAFRAFLQTPHGGMPNIIVSPEQAGDLHAYIRSLRPAGE